LAYDQEYLGKLVLSSRRHVPELSQLNRGELFELGRMFARVEGGLDQAFQPDYYNWACLMNESWRTGACPHVHFHVIPRYRSPRTVLNERFNDARFGKSARTVKPHKVTLQIQDVIFRRLRGLSDSDELNGLVA
jgi:diadenosine tetraphosphate (Ap4A) HIT family hydrolase